SCGHSVRYGPGGRALGPACGRWADNGHRDEYPVRTPITGRSRETAPCGGEGASAPGGTAPGGTAPGGTVPGGSAAAAGPPGSRSPVPQDRGVDHVGEPAAAAVGVALPLGAGPAR